jgi:hypothetical protein
VFPNPSPDGKFSVYSVEPPTHMEIFDVYGKKIFDRKINTEFETVSINAANGIYLFKITMLSGKTASGKLILSQQEH